MGLGDGKNLRKVKPPPETLSSIYIIKEVCLLLAPLAPVGGVLHIGAPTTRGGW
jgi:hypothetical protein